MVLKLYGDLRSPCVRACLIAAKILNVDFEYIFVDVVRGEQHNAEFLKLNPSHTVPVLDDDGFILWESHAIMVYLAEKYGNNNSLYPADIQKRSVINQMLHFENGDLFAFHKFIALQLIRRGELPVEAIEKLKSTLEHLNSFLNKTKYIAGDTLTIADLSVWTTVTNTQVYLPFDKIRYPKLAEYMKLMDNLPYGSELNQKGFNQIKEFIASLKKTKA